MKSYIGMLPKNRTRAFWRNYINPHHIMVYMLFAKENIYHERTSLSACDCTDVLVSGTTKKLEAVKLFSTPIRDLLMMMRMMHQPAGRR